MSNINTYQQVYTPRSSSLADRVLLDLLCKHTGIRRCPPCVQVAFTGSSAVGKQILASAAATMKHVSVECGGKCPLIVCADANVDEVSTLTMCHDNCNKGR